MAIPAVFTWPVPDTQAISLTQTLVAAGNLLINGNLSFNSSVALQGIGRTVSLTSTGNNSGVNFTITGTRYGRPVTETRAGPNVNTVETTAIFDTITSISVNGAVTAVSAGTGSTGETNWYNSNYHATVLGMTIQVGATAAITYSFQTTLDDVQINSTPTVSTPVVNLTAATTTQIGFYNNSTRYSKIVITASDLTGSLVATFLQQGIT